MEGLRAGVGRSAIMFNWTWWAFHSQYWPPSTLENKGSSRKTKDAPKGEVMDGNLQGDNSIKGHFAIKCDSNSQKNKVTLFQFYMIEFNFIYLKRDFLAIKRLITYYYILLIILTTINFVTKKQ